MKLSCVKGDFVDAMVKCGAIEFDFDGVVAGSKKPPFRFCYEKMTRGEGLEALSVILLVSIVNAKNSIFSFPSRLGSDIIFGPPWLVHIAVNTLTKCGYGVESGLIGSSREGGSAIIVEETTAFSEFVFEALPVITEKYEVVGRLAISDLCGQHSGDCSRYGDLPTCTIVTVDELVEYWCDPEVVWRGGAMEEIHQLMLKYRRALSSKM